MDVVVNGEVAADVSQPRSLSSASGEKPRVLPLVLPLDHHHKLPKCSWRWI